MKTKVICTFLLAAAGVHAQGIVFPESRRLEVLDGLKSILEYESPSEEELHLIPDPFVFGREIEEEKEETVMDGLSNEEVLEILGRNLRNSVIGYQEFGTRAFLATSTFGLLRNGDSILMIMPESPDEKISIKILSPSRNGVTIEMGDLQFFVPLNGQISGVTNSRP